MLLLGLGVTGCLDCEHYESRGGSTQVRLPAPGAEAEQFFALSVEEFRGAQWKGVGFSVSGASLRWHVRRVRLLESAGEKPELFDILLDTPGADPDEAAHGQASAAELKTGTWERFLMLVESHGVEVELTTDVPGMERVLLPVNVPNASDWQTSPCRAD